MVTVPVTSGNRERLRPVAGNRTIARPQSNMVGESLERLGGALSEAANDVDQIDAIYDDAGASELVNKYQEYSRARLHTDDDAFYNSRGGDAGRDAPTQTQALGAYRDELLTEASSERMRNLARRQMERLYGRDEEQISNYANGQMFEYRNNQSLAMIDNSQQDYVDAINLGDTGAADMAMMSALMQFGSLAGRSGWPKEEFNQRTEAFISGTHIAVVNDMVARGNPVAAAGYLDEHAGDIIPEQETQMRNALGPAVDRAFADGRVAEIMGSGVAPVVPDSDETQPVQFATPLGGQGVTVQGGQWGAPRSYGGHTGVDYAAPTGTPVNPTAPGRVTFVGRRGGYGNQVVVDHGGGLETRYSHLNNFNVSVGQTVDMAANVGGVGNTGQSSGPHLHYQVFRDGRPVNPATVTTAQVSTGGGGGDTYSTAAVRAAVEADISANNYSERRAQAMRDAADRHVGEARAMRAEGEDEAYRQGMEIANGIGHRQLTDPSQIDPLTWQAMGPAHRSTMLGRMERNRQSNQEDRSDMTLFELSYLRYSNPEAFRALDEREFADDLNTEDAQRFLLDLAQARQDGREVNSAIRSAIQQGTAALGISTAPDASPADQARVGAINYFMQRYLDQLVGTNGQGFRERDPNQTEINAAFDRSVIAFQTERTARRMIENHFLGRNTGRAIADARERGATNARREEYRQ